MDSIDPIYLQRIFEQDINEPDRVQRAQRSRDDRSPDEDERQDAGTRDGDDNRDDDEDDERALDEESLELDLSDAATAAETVVRGEVLDIEPEEIEAPAEPEAPAELAAPTASEAGVRELEAGASELKESPLELGPAPGTIIDDSNDIDADAVVVELDADLEPRLYERRREGDDDSHVDFEV